ncbi:winged helix-turn-helix transcriptional regulator [Segatella salivae]
MKLIVEKPYITKDEMATITGLNASTIMRNIKKCVAHIFVE